LCHRGGQFHARGTGTNQDECHLASAFILVIGCVRQFRGAQKLGADGLGVAEALETRCKSCKLVMAEITWPHPCGDDQVIESDFACADFRVERVDGASIRVHSGHIGKKYSNVLFLLGDLSDRGRDVGWRKNRSRHLIEQRLEDVMVASVNQNDVGIAPL
jgi:hypothetical protein